MLAPWPSGCCRTHLQLADLAPQGRNVALCFTATRADTLEVSPQLRLRALQCTELGAELLTARTTLRRHHCVGSLPPRSLGDRGDNNARRAEHPPSEGQDHPDVRWNDSQLSRGYSAGSAAPPPRLPYISDVASSSALCLACSSAVCRSSLQERPPAMDISTNEGTCGHALMQTRTAVEDGARLQSATT